MYALGLVANSRDLMNRFMTGVCELVEEECFMELHFDDMYISKTWCFLNIKKNPRLGRRKKINRMDKQGPMNMVILKIDKCFLGKAIIVPLSMKMKLCLTLYLKGIISIPNIHELVVVKTIRVGVRP